MNRLSRRVAPRATSRSATAPSTRPNPLNVPANGSVTLPTARVSRRRRSRYTTTATRPPARRDVLPRILRDRHQRPEHRHRHGRNPEAMDGHVRDRIWRRAPAYVVERPEPGRRHCTRHGDKQRWRRRVPPQNRLRDHARLVGLRRGGTNPAPASAAPPTATRLRCRDFSINGSATPGAASTVPYGVEIGPNGNVPTSFTIQMVDNHRTRTPAMASASP